MLQGGPGKLVSSLVSHAVASIFNHLLDQRHGLAAILYAHANRVLAFDVAGLHLPFSFTKEGQIEPSQLEIEYLKVDTTIHIDAKGLMLAAPEVKSAIGKNVRIEGDIDLAQTFAQVLSQLKWDVELDLSKVIGDVPAVWLVQTLKQLGLNVQDVFSRFKQALQEYLVYEQALMPTISEFSEFKAELSDVTDQIARLEKRLDKLVGF